MALELDHLFIFTSVGAREVEQLLKFGLTEGEPNTHPGQGTACRRFFFHNAYLEFLWVHDEQEATNA
jgi:Glyoxalase-like domain